MTTDTHFLNVDLDIYSRSDLQPLVDGFGKKVIPMYVGRERRRYSAHFELAGIQKSSADSTIRSFCKLIRALPTKQRELWSGATKREFSVGVQAEQKPLATDFRIEAKTVRAAADLGAAIVLTVYASDKAKAGKVRKSAH